MACTALPLPSALASLLKTFHFSHLFFPWRQGFPASLLRKAYGSSRELPPGLLVLGAGIRAAKPSDLKESRLSWVHKLLRRDRGVVALGRPWGQPGAGAPHRPPCLPQ